MNTLTSLQSHITKSPSTPITVTTPSLYTQNAVYIFRFNTGEINGQTITDWKTGSAVARTDCVLLNAATSTANSKFGDASLYLNGNGRITIPPIVFSSTGFTWCCWYYIDSLYTTSDNYSLFAFEDLSPSVNGALANILYNKAHTSAGTTSVWQEIVNGAETTTKQIKFSNGSGPVSLWNHIALVFDGTTGAVYFNGSFTTSKAYSISSFIGHTFQYTTIGCAASQGGVTNTFAKTGFVGYIDDWRFYNEPLTADKIAEIAAGTQ